MESGRVKVRGTENRGEVLKAVKLVISKAELIIYFNMNDELHIFLMISYILFGL
jgi:hypothetical protein